MAKKCTQAELQLRIDAVIALIARGYRDGQIKRMIAGQFGCASRTVERYLRRARDEIVARRNRPRHELQADSLAFYESVLADPKAKQRDKLHAAKRRDQLLGLDEPRRHEVSGPEGRPIETRNSVDLVHRLADDPETRAPLMDLAERLAESMVNDAEAEQDASDQGAG